MKAEVARRPVQKKTIQENKFPFVYGDCSQNLTFAPLVTKKRGERKKKKKKRTIPKKEFPKNTKSLEGKLRTKCRQNQGLLQNV